MINKNIYVVLYAIPILVIVSGCNQQIKNPAEFGHFENGLYENALFGLTVELPQDWHVLSKQQIEAMSEVAKLAAGDDEKLRKQYKEQMERTSMLLTAFMYPIPKTDGYNPSFGCTAENMKYYSGIKNGKDFLELVKNTLSRGQVKATFPEQIQQITINGTQFYMLPIESIFDNYSVKQKYFVISLKGYLLTFLATYESQRDYEKIDKIFKSIRLKS